MGLSRHQGQDQVACSAIMRPGFLLVVRRGRQGQQDQRDHRGRQEHKGRQGHKGRRGRKARKVILAPAPGCLGQQGHRDQQEQ